jgi:7-carboxy-7-deazaguanine synthase
MGTLFLRFGGCNLRCPGWPCDTLFAVLPEFRQDWSRRSAGSVLKDVLQRCREANIANACLTGGEPFLQNNEALRLIVEGLLAEDIQVEAFSNGQIKYPEWAFDQVNFTMDWKLEGSGNPANDPKVLPLMLDNIKNLKPTDAIKFVVKDVSDYSEAVEVHANYAHLTGAQWWAGVVWEGDLKEAELLDMFTSDALPWNLNVQMHKYLWPADARGV